MTTLPTVGASPPSNPSDERVPFYVTGGTLPASASSYVARAADAALQDALRRGEFCYVLNTRQMGKSSLMARTADLLRQSGVSVAILDLTAVGQNLSVAQWYNGLLERVAQQLNIEEPAEAYWDRHRDAGPMQRFLGALREVALPALPGELVIFIDEIDAVRSLPFSTDELFAGIRELFNRRTLDPELSRLTFCLLGVATPADLIRDTRTTPFNIGVRIDLDDFTPAEAAPLAQGMVGSQAVLDRALYWTGGHPYLTQRLCRAIADEPRNVAPSDVDVLCERLFLSQRARDTEDNLLFVRERVLRTDLDLPALLGLYQRVLRGRPGVQDDPADPLVSALKLAGLGKTDLRGRLQVRNRIYAQVFGRAWVTENMPGAEVRRQRRAFRRGALRAGMVAAVIVAIIGTLAGIAVKEAHEAQRQSARFERLLYVSDMQNAQSAWDSGNLGHLRDLLAQTKSSPERGWEWGYWNHLAYPPGDVVNPGDGPLVACDITKDGARLLTVGSNGMLRLWDTRTLHQILSVQYPGKTPTYGRFSLDGSEFMGWDETSGLATYSAATGKMLFSSQPNQPGASSDMSPDFKAANEYTANVGIKIVRADTGRAVGFLPCQGNNAQAQNANHAENLFVFILKPFVAAIYSYQTGACLCRLQMRGVVRQDPDLRGQFSNDDRHLVTVGENFGSGDLWDARTGRLVQHLTDMNDPTSERGFAMVNPSLPLVLIHNNNGGRLREYSTESGQQILDVPFPDSQQTFRAAHFSQNGRYLGFVGSSGSVFLLDCKTGTRSGDYLGHVAAATDLAFLPTGSQFFSVSSDGTLRRWNTSQTPQIQWQTVRFPQGTVPVFSKLFDHEQRAYTSEKPATIRLWSISANRAKPLCVLSRASVGGAPPSDNRAFQPLVIMPNDTTNVYDMWNGHCLGRAIGDPVVSAPPAITPDGQRLATVAASGATSVFEVRSGARLWTRKGGNSVVNRMDFSPSGRLLGSGGAEGVVDVWDAATGRQVATLNGGVRSIHWVKFLPGDKRLVTSGDQTLCCWDIPTGRCLWTVQSPLGISAWLSCSPDGQRLLAGTPHGAVGVWDTQTGDLLLTLRGNVSYPDPIFSPDGATLEISDETGRYVNYVADMRDLSRGSAAGH